MTGESLKLAFIAAVVLSTKGCNETVHFDPVDVMGLMDCGQGFLKRPIVFHMDHERGNLETLFTQGVKYSFTTKKSTPQAIQMARYKVSARIKVGVCDNEFSGSGSYECLKPVRWYHEQTYDYDPGRPAPIQIPDAGGQACLELK